MSPPRFDRIDTPRLVVRRFQEADLAAFVAYRSNPEVARYQSWSDYEPAPVTWLSRTLCGSRAGKQAGTAGGR